MKMDTILCSIDGRPETTNRCRGEGTYERIMENVACIKAKGFPNDLVARMTVSVEQNGDIYDDVMHILCLSLRSFTPTPHQRGIPPRALAAGLQLGHSHGGPSGHLVSLARHVLQPGHHSSGRRVRASAPRGAPHPAHRPVHRSAALVGLVSMTHPQTSDGRASDGSALRKRTDRLQVGEGIGRDVAASRPEEG